MRVLVVEDDRDLRKFLINALREESYEVDEADSGDRAIERGLAGLYQCIVLDVMLPGRDGFAVVSELRARKIATPVLMLTARDDLDSRGRGPRGGGAGYFLKT